MSYEEIPAICPVCGKDIYVSWENTTKETDYTDCPWCNADIQVGKAISKYRDSLNRYIGSRSSGANAEAVRSAGPQLVQCSCPCCGGQLEINREGFTECPYCRASLYFDNGAIKINVVYRDEAKVKEAEIRLSEIEERRQRYAKEDEEIQNEWNLYNANLAKSKEAIIRTGIVFAVWVLFACLSNITSEVFLLGTVTSFIRSVSSITFFIFFCIAIYWLVMTSKHNPSEYEASVKQRRQAEELNRQYLEERRQAKERELKLEMQKQILKHQQEQADKERKLEKEARREARKDKLVDAISNTLNKF